MKRRSPLRWAGLITATALVALAVIPSLSLYGAPAKTQTHQAIRVSISASHTSVTAANFNVAFDQI